MNLRSTDKYLRHVTDFPRPGIGLVVEDLIGKTPHPEICRSKDTSISALVEVLRRDSQHILCRGAAAGIGQDGLVCHIRPGLHGFIGFIEKNLTDGKIAVTSRGGFVLPISGLSKNAPGEIIFTDGPDSFNCESRGYPMGPLLYIDPQRNDRGLVVFNRYDSPRKTLIDYSRFLVKFT